MAVEALPWGLLLGVSMPIAMFGGCCQLFAGLPFNCLLLYIALSCFIAAAWYEGS